MSNQGFRAEYGLVVNYPPSGWLSEVMNPLLGCRCAVEWRVVYISRASRRAVLTSVAAEKTRHTTSVMPRAARAILPSLFSPKRCTRTGSAQISFLAWQQTSWKVAYLARAAANAHVHNVLGLTPHLGCAVRFLLSMSRVSSRVT